MYTQYSMCIGAMPLVKYIIQMSSVFLSGSLKVMWEEGEGERGEGEKGGR